MTHKGRVVNVDMVAGVIAVGTKVADITVNSGFTMRDTGSLNDSNSSLQDLNLSKLRIPNFQKFEDQRNTLRKVNNYNNKI